MANSAQRTRQAGLQDRDAAKSSSVMKAMMKMTKIDIKGLEQAHAQA
jgi:predicted 3-demethylubiquinone-9 3-methyltransferase (glyoxalase superfamily)